MKKELRIKKKYLKYIFLGGLLSFLVVYNKTNFEASGGGAQIEDGGTVNITLKSISNEVASSFSSEIAMEGQETNSYSENETSIEGEETFAFGNGSSGFLESSNFSSGLSNNNQREAVVYHSQGSSGVEYNSTSYSAAASSSPIAFDKGASAEVSSSRRNSFHKSGTSSKIAKAGFKGGFSGFGSEAPMAAAGPPPPPGEPIPLDKEAYILLIVGIAFGLFQLFKTESLKDFLKLKGQ